jgi:hypothetical protein
MWGVFLLLDLDFEALHTLGAIAVTKHYHDVGFAFLSREWCDCNAPVGNVAPLAFEFSAFDLIAESGTST